MADHITDITYPQRYTVSGTEGDYIGIMEYYDGGTSASNLKFNFQGAYYDEFHFQVHPQTSPTDRPLIIDLADYGNGTSLVLEYFTSPNLSSGTATINGTLKWVDTRTRNPIENFTYRDGNVTRTFVNESSIALQAKGLTNIQQLENVPFRYYGSDTFYYADGTANVGDPATEVVPFGVFITTDSNTLHPMSELGAVVDYSTMTHHPRFYITNGEFYTNEGKDNFEDGYIDAGNGKDPFIDPTTPSDNPYENDHSHTGGGGGGYKPKGDITGKPGLPTSGVLGSGFIAMYAPSAAQMQNLGAKMWSDDFFDNFLKLWNDPMEAIITLGLVPFTPTSTGSTNVVIGNYDTEISMPRVTSQYETFSCGSITIEEFWGNALDYGPYTAAEIYLPFVGMRQLDIDDIMGKTVSVDYNVDLLGGEAIAYITVDDRVLYDFRCNLMTSVPISSSSYAALYSGILKGISAAAIGGAMGGGVGAAAGALTSAVNVVTSKHSTVERGGDSTPNAGVLGLLTPYIILHRPVQSLPQNFGHFKGFPSNVTRTLGNMSGYTEIEYIHLDGINATEEEKEEIYSLLKAGVML